MDLNATYCATLVDEWARAGVGHAVVAPGSRSTPLALALAADPRIQVHVFLDERSAGFFGVGLGLAGAGPAVVLTTSGTAAAELHPAVVEAHHARVPLLACTADRPPELQDVGAPQTVDQVDLYGRAVRWSAHPGPPDRAAADSWRSLAARAVAEARGRAGPPGPVHLNLAFREPLVGAPGPLQPGRRDGGGWHGPAWPAPRRASAAAVTELGRLVSGRRGVLVAGGGAPGAGEDVHRLARVLGWPVLADPRSDARIPAPTTVAAFDAILRPGPFAEWSAPEVVVRIGSAPASKILAGWCAPSGRPGPVVIAVDAHGAVADPERAAAALVAANPGWLARDLSDSRPRPAPDWWLAGWARAEEAAQSAFDRVLADHPEPTEPGTARQLAASLPDGSALVVSSSMPCRDVEWYARPRRGLTVLGNRGANGIDGVVSTALGAAAGRPGRPTAALIGDLAFLHDCGGLLRAPGRAPAVLVVVDNDGGGIFSFLPQAGALAETEFETLFGTPHGIDLARLCAGYGVEASEVGEAARLSPALTSALASGSTRVVVVPTSRAANVTVHDELHAAVAEALDVVTDTARAG